MSDFSPFREFKNFYAWAKVFVNVKKKKINATQEINDYRETKPELDEILQKMYITITQKEAGFNQQVKEFFHTVDMEQRTVNLFKTLKRDKIIQTELNTVTADTAGKLLTKCHQLASGTIINDAGEYRIIDFSKIDYILRTFRDKKIAIFYKFKSELEMIINRTSDAWWTDNPEVFNRSNELIFCGQVSSAREGVNLETADCLVMLNIDFAAVFYLQPINRLQTQKRTKPAETHWIFSNIGIEQKIYQTVREKEKNYTASIFLRDKF